MEPVVVTTRESLNELVSEAVRTAISDVLPEAVRQATTKPYLTKKELMELTGWSSRQVEYKKSKKELPYVKRGRLILFPTDEVYAYLNEGYVSAAKDR